MHAHATQRSMHCRLNQIVSRHAHQSDGQAGGHPRTQRGVQGGLCCLRGQAGHHQAGGNQAVPAGMMSTQEATNISLHVCGWVHHMVRWGAVGRLLLGGRQPASLQQMRKLLRIHSSPRLAHQLAGSSANCPDSPVRPHLPKYVRNLARWAGRDSTGHHKSRQHTRGPP